VLETGAAAPSFSLSDAESGQTVDNPWAEGPVVLAFFKTTCPVCQMAAPKVQAMADGGARVLAVGEDPPEALRAFAERHGQRVTTVTEASPYAVSAAFELHTVPALVLVDADGTVLDSVFSWEREGWNRIAERAGAPPVSHEGDGLPAQRPG
jgi:peroxiredoxin